MVVATGTRIKGGTTIRIREARTVNKRSSSVGKNDVNSNRNRIRSDSSVGSNSGSSASNSRPRSGNSAGNSNVNNNRTRIASVGNNSGNAISSKFRSGNSAGNSNVNNNRTRIASAGNNSGNAISSKFRIANVGSNNDRIKIAGTIRTGGRLKIKDVAIRTSRTLGGANSRIVIGTRNGTTSVATTTGVRTSSVGPTSIVSNHNAGSSCNGSVSARLSNRDE